MEKREGEDKGEWLSLTPKDALEDIEMMCEKLLTRKNVMTDSLGDEEYKRYVDVFLNLERRRCLHEVLKEATDATRHVNTKSLLEINLLRYLQEQNDDLSNILRSSETGKRIENRLNRRLAGSRKSSKDYDDMQDVMDTFRLCITPQIFIETIEETFLKGRRLRFASSGVPEFASSLRGGPYHETENMRTDMCRQIGPCFVLNSQSFTTKTLKQCVLDLSEAMRRVQISTCGEKTIQKGTGHDHLSRMMLRAADHVTSGSILVNTIGTMLFPSEGKGAMASEVAMMIPEASNDEESKSEDVPPSFSLDVGCFVVAEKKNDEDEDENVVSSSSRQENVSHEEDDDEERRMRVRAEAVATMRKEEIKRMKEWFESRVGETDDEEEEKSEHLRCSLIDYIETTEDRVLRKGHTAQDFLRENDEEWGLSESWRQAVQMFLNECKEKSSRRSWYWGLRARVRTTTEFRVYPNDTEYVSQGRSPWAIVRGELDVHFGMPMNGDDVKLIGVDVCVSLKPV